MSRAFFLPGSLLAICLATPPVFAATATDSSELLALNTVVVTAARIQQQSDDVLVPLSVINREDIDRLQDRDVVDLLAHTPSADVVRSGGPGSAASLFLRGTNDDHTLFLIDGQRVSSATLGTTNFQLLDPEQIDHIEILRGPRSSLYGSDAIGGVVQIFTRRPGKDPEGYVKAGYGNHDSSQIAAGGGGTWDRLRLSGNISHYYTGGISNLKDKTPNNDDRDAYRNTSLNLHAGYDFSATSALDLFHFYTQAMNQYDSKSDPTHQPWSDNWIQNTGAVLTSQFSTIWNSKWSVARSIDDFDTRAKFDSSNDTNFRTTRDSASWQNDFLLGDAQTLTAGVDYYKDVVDSSSDFTKPDGEPVHSRDHKGYFTQYLTNWKVVDLQLGLRRDLIEDFSGQTTENIAVGFNLPANQKLIASFGTAYKAPTFNDLYWPVSPYDFGNPNLKAETSKNYELEWRGSYEKLNWAANVFQNRIRNLIDWAPVDPNDPYSAWTPSNVADAKITGAEFSVDGNVWDWLVRSSISYVNPRDTATDTILVNRSRRQFKLDADRQLDAFSFGVSWHAQDFRYANTTNTQKLGGYGLVDLRMGYQFSKSLQAQLKLNNIFDTNYVQRQGFNVERFGAFATLTYRM